MALMEKYIQDSLERQELLFVHDEADDTNTFKAGVVNWWDDDWLGMSLVGLAGEFDGYVAVRCSQIYRVSRGGNYFDALVMAIPPEGLPRLLCKDLKGFLDHVVDTHAVIWVKDRHGAVTKGCALSHDAEDLEFLAYAADHHFGATEVARVEDLVEIAFGGPDQKLLDRVAQAKRLVEG